MSCCFGSKDPESNEQDDSPVAQPKGNPNSMSTMTSGPFSQTVNKNQEGRASAAATTAPATINTHEANEAMDNLARNFGFREVAMATKNFRRECLLGESAFGKVYKGTLQGSGQVVAVKQLDRHGTKANKEFLVEVMRLSHLKHPNLAQLIGYCADGDQRILVYEYMKSGGLKAHLHEVPPEGKPLDWITRMKVASGSAEAIEYLHEKANPPILYRNFKSSNIMLDENFNPKLTDYGLLRLQIDSGNTMQQRIVGTVGCAPEYEQNGELTPKSDVYSFGIVLLELITGRKALDTDRPVDEQNVVTWAQPYFKEPKRFPEMADPQLQGAFPERSLNQAVGVAAMCVQEEPSVRPLISDVVAALSFLTVAPPSPKTHPTPASTHNPDEKTRSPSSSREVEQAREASSSHNDGTEETSYTDSDEEYEQRPIGNNNNKPEYGEDGDVSWSSESLYNEDDYGEDESQPEETSYRVKSKPKSIKRKVTFQTESRNGSRNSSKGSTKSFKTHSNLRKKSVNRKSSRNKTVDGSVSKKSHEVLKDDQSSSNSNQSNNKSRSRRNSKSNMHSSSRRSKSKKIVIVESSDSSFSSSSDESNRRIVTFD